MKSPIQLKKSSPTTVPNSDRNSPRQSHQPNPSSPSQPHNQPHNQPQNQPHNQPQNVTYVTQNIYVANPNFTPYMQPPYMNPHMYPSPFYSNGFDPNFAYNPNYPNPNYPVVPQYYSDPYTQPPMQPPMHSYSPYNYPQTQQGTKPNQFNERVDSKPQDINSMQQQVPQTQVAKPRPIAGNDLRRSAPTGSSSSHVPTK